MNAENALRWDSVDFEYTDESDMPPVAVSDDDHAEAHLRALDSWRYQAEQIEAHAQKQIERAQRWRDEELRKIAPRIQYHESGLVAYIQQTGKKTLRLVNGTIKRIAGRSRVEVTDYGALEKWCEEQDCFLFRVKTEPDKTAIMHRIKDAGELPAGVDLVTGDDSFKIETA